MLLCLTPVIVSNHYLSSAPNRTLPGHVPYVLIIALFSSDGISYSSIAFRRFYVVLGQMHFIGLGVHIHRRVILPMFFHELSGHKRHISCPFSSSETMLPRS